MATGVRVGRWARIAGVHHEGHGTGQEAGPHYVCTSLKVARLGEVMSKLHLAAAKAAVIATVLFSTSIFAVAPTNPSFEDFPDLDGWTVEDIGGYGGVGYVVRGEDATDGDAFGRLSFFAMYAYGEMAYGPAFRSSTFSAGAGEEITADWRVRALGGWCAGDPGSGDDGLGRGFLVDALTDLAVATFFDTEPICGVTEWATASVIAPAFGDYYLLFQVGSFDATDGGVIGAQLDVDNITGNQPPDCSDAQAVPAMLWPPNHKFHDIEIVGVTDPDGDETILSIDSVFQDEPINSADDGNTCPDASGIGTGTASVRAERVGGELGYEGDGRFYWINFTAMDVFGATCSGTVKVSVPHDKQTPAVDAGPLFDSTSCP